MVSRIIIALKNYDLIVYVAPCLISSGPEFMSQPAISHSASTRRDMVGVAEAF